MARNGKLEPEWGTIPQAARRFGLGVKMVRRMAREGAFPVYLERSGWPRVKYTEVEIWLRSTRLRPTSHARARLAEVLEQERRPR